METKVITAFLSGPEGPQSFELTSAQKEEIKNQIEAYRDCLLEAHEEVLPDTVGFAAMKVDYEPVYETTSLGPFSMYVFSHDIEELKAGRGDLIMIWPEGYYEYMQEIEALAEKSEV